MIDGLNSITPFTVGSIPPADDWGAAIADKRFIIYGALLDRCHDLAAVGHLPVAAAARIRASPTPSPGMTEPPAPVLVAAGLGMRFEGLNALSDVDLVVPARRNPRPHRPKRRRQDHLLQLRHRLLPPDAGSLQLAGRRIDGLPMHEVSALGVSRTFQNIRLFANMTAVENVLVGGHRHIHVGGREAVDIHRRGRRSARTPPRPP